MAELLDGETHDWWKEKAKKWTAGSNIEEAIERITDFNKKGYRVVVNSIAAAANDKEAIENTKNNYVSLIEAIGKNNLNAGITVRTTNLGMGMSYEEAKNALRTVLDKAKEKGVGIEVDMEERPFVEKTMKLVSEMIEEGHFLRICVQAAIKDSYDKVAKLLEGAEGRLTIRIVTGAVYKETRELNETETIKQFYKLMLLCGKGSAVGTHITERILCANAIGIETQVLMGFEDKQPEGSVDTIYAAFGDWKTNEGIRDYIKRREK